MLETPTSERRLQPIPYTLSDSLTAKAGVGILITHETADIYVLLMFREPSVVVSLYQELESIRQSGQGIKKNSELFIV